MVAIGILGYPGGRRNTDFAKIHRFPANIPKLVKVKNLLNWRRFTYRSSAAKTGNSSRQSGVLEGFRNQRMIFLPGIVGDIDANLTCFGRSHHVDLGRDLLVAE